MGKKIAALLLALAMVFSLAGCGGTDGASELKKYIESDEFQTQLSAMTASMEDSGVKMEVSADGEKLIYACTFTEQLDNTDNQYGELLDSALDTQASTFQSIADQLKSELKIEGATVVVTYLNADGSTLASREFKAQ